MKRLGSAQFRCGDTVKAIRVCRPLFQCEVDSVQIFPLTGFIENSEIKHANGYVLDGNRGAKVSYTVRLMLAKTYTFVQKRLMSSGTPA